MSETERLRQVSMLVQAARRELSKIANQTGFERLAAQQLEHADDYLKRSALELREDGRQG